MDRSSLALFKFSIDAFRSKFAGGDIVRYFLTRQIKACPD